MVSWSADLFLARGGTKQSGRSHAIAGILS
jgi:hypothetical protein